VSDIGWWVLFGVYALLVLRWLWGHVELRQAMRSGMLVPGTHIDPKMPRPAVSVIIAAHNEAGTIGQCLARVLSQDYPDLQVLVANDRSTDATGQIVRDIAADHPNVRCIDVEDLPEGWLGKTHAVSVAAAQATGDYLLFLDSDVELHPTAVSTAMDLAQRRQIDFLSLWPKVILAGFWARFFLPALGWTLSLWFPNPRPDRTEKTPVFAAGAFLLIRKQAYEQIGGHAAVPDEMAEDVSLARRARDAGQRRYMGLGRNLFQTRMDESLNRIIHSWTRIFIGTLGAGWKLALTIFGALIGVAPAFAVMAILLVRASGGSGFGPMQWCWLVAAIIHVAAIYTVVYRYSCLGYEGRPHIAPFPLALLGVAALLGYCLFIVAGLGTIRWGNMQYRVAGSRAVSGKRADG
jgi:glycosyltransferase involved in cell wall biosynthesis